MKAAIEDGKKGAWIRGVWHPNNYHSETYVPKIIREKWFVMTSDNQFDLYDSESEAYNMFLKSIDEERDLCHDDSEWRLEVEDVCWGKVFQDVILREVPNPYNEGIDLTDEDYDTNEYYEAFANERRILK